MPTKLEHRRGVLLAFRLTADMVSSETPWHWGALLWALPLLLGGTMMARKRQQWTYEGQEEMSVKELAAMPTMCAWRGCLNAAPAAGKGDLPPDWVYLLTYWWPQPMEKMAEIVGSKFCTRDAVLCGEHARQLERLLKSRDGPDPATGQW